VETSVIIGIVVCFGILLVFLFAGAWVFASMVVAGIVAGYFLVGSLDMTAYIPFNSASSWTLTAIPLFVFMGAIFQHGGISEGLYRGASVLLGRFRGGLLHSNIGACALFAAITGSTTATAVTVGSVALPELEKRNYAPEITTGSLAAGSTLGPLIPPSTPFIIYGSMTNTSIGKLFFAGLFPGLVETLLYMMVIFIWVSFRPGIAPAGERVTLKRLLLAMKDLGPIALISVLVLGGIYMGVYTPVEAGAAGCICSLLLSLALRRLSWKALHEAALATIKTTTFVMIIIVGSAVLGNVLAQLLIPFQLANWLAGLPVSPTMILFFLCLMYLAFGCVIESLPVLIMTLPVVFPVAVELGFDLIWFGVVLVLLTNIGTITPPVGISLYAIQGLRTKGSLLDVIKGVIPFIFAALVLLAIVIAFPPLSTWLPAQMITR